MAMRGAGPTPGDAHFDAAVVSSGFGGSVSAYRLAQAGRRVCVLERGIDRPQFRYFDEVVGAGVQEGDSIILCSAVPSWVHANEDSAEAYVTLDYLERTIVRKHAAAVRLSLCGDSHHYARYQAEDGSQKITAGGGGAYLSATHHRPEKLELPPATSRDPGKTSPSRHYQLKKRYPSESTSRQLRWGAAALPSRNGSFWALIGIVYLLYAWMIQEALRPPQAGPCRVLHGAVSRGSGREPAQQSAGPAVQRRRGLRADGVHQGEGVVETARRRASRACPPRAHRHHHRAGDGNAGECRSWRSGFLVLLGVCGGLLSSWLTATYLFLTDKIGCNTNELFAAQRIRDYKNFLRLHLDSTGAVTIYPIKVERTRRHWRLRRGGAPDDPWFEPTDGPIQAELIEQPIRVEPAHGTVTTNGDLRRAAQ